MKVKRYAVYADILNLLMIELFCTMLIWYLQVVVNFMVSVWIPLSLGIILAFVYFVRRDVHRLSVYILLHVLGLTGLVLLPFPGIDHVFILCFAVVWGVMDIIFWTEQGKKGIEMLPVWMVLLFLTAYIHASLIGNEFLENAAYAGGIIFTGLFFLRLYSLNIIRFSKDKQMHEQVPVAMMFAQNGKMVAALVICFVMGMLLLRSQLLIDGLQVLFLMIRDAVVEFLVWIMKIIKSGLPEDALLMQEEAQFEIPPAADVNPFWNRLFYIMEVIIKWVMIIAFLYWAGNGIRRFLIRYRWRNPRKEEEICYDGIKETKSWILRGREQKKINLWRNLSNAEKIRRLYRKQVEHYTKSGYSLSRAHTPQERAADIHRWKDHGANKTAVFEDLTSLYETARYSTHDIGTEEVRRVK
ncbi:MAG: DUF4129 domain-containing protein [bacterium]|nr:DUF4129 domain-containing protein [bacterium]